MTLPVYMVVCPIHDRLVGTNIDGRLVGRCPACIQEAADAQRKIERRELAVQLPLLGSV